MLILANSRRRRALFRAGPGVDSGIASDTAFVVCSDVKRSPIIHGRQEGAITQQTSVLEQKNWR
ncbi:hypothetical protein [Mycobacterium sp.]|uniref:hypothetical protein n=1 Tax=Mycobacterium sp. TaxID=1785 RepID=UPI003BACA52E